MSVCFSVEIGTVLSVGVEAPWGPFGRAGARLMPDEAYLMVVHQLPVDATARQLRLCERGRVDVGLALTGATAMLVWRFKATAGAIAIETPLHMGLEEKGSRDLPIDSEGIRVLFVTQDHSGVCLSFRFGTIGLNVSGELERAVAQQNVASDDPDLLDRYQDDVARWEAGTNDTMAAFARTRTRCCVIEASK